MCGRFYIPEADGPDELMALLNRAELARKARQPDFRLKRGEICPGDTAVVLAPNRNRQTSLFLMRWGFQLNRRLVFNARSETASQKPMFRDSLQSRRCIIPAAAFFEWDHRLKRTAKFRFWTEGRSMIYMAGLYRFEPDMPLPAFTILTRQAQGNIADIHDRMPLILKAEQLDLWLDPGLNPQFLIDEEPPRLACQPEITAQDLPLLSLSE